MKHSSLFQSLPFLWGSATSSHQVEGNNRNNDWWEWEQSQRLGHASGASCDHYNRFREDFDLISKLGHNTYRFSIEWSRIEPEDGKWDPEALHTYRMMIEELRKRKIIPVVTLHHFTNPQWFSKRGGWLCRKSADYFSRYVRKVVTDIGEKVSIWITINEPLIYLTHSYFLGVWPPGKQSFRDSVEVFENLLMAHAQAYHEIHSIYETVHRSPVAVSIAKHALYSEPCRKNSFLDRTAVFLREWFFNDAFLQGASNGFLYFPGLFCKNLPYHHTLDFLGMNYYSRQFVRYKGFEEGAIFGDTCEDRHHDSQIAEKNYLGWQVYPEGLYRSLMRMSRYNLPILITENGICTDDDSQRERFIRSHLAMVRSARVRAPIVGYLYWSLLDNFEWDKGFGPRFGIVEVNFENLKRKIRNSAYVLSDLCRQIGHGKSDPPVRFI